MNEKFVFGTWYPIRSARHEGEPVLLSWPVTSGREIQIGYTTDGEHWFDGYHRERMHEHPTHWMPLPKFEKGE